MTSEQLLTEMAGKSPLLTYHKKKILDLIELTGVEITNVTFGLSTTGTSSIFVHFTGTITHESFAKFGYQGLYVKGNYEPNTCLYITDYGREGQL